MLSTIKKKKKEILHIYQKIFQWNLFLYKKVSYKIKFYINQILNNIKIKKEEHSIILNKSYWRIKNFFFFNRYVIYIIFKILTAFVVSYFIADSIEYCLELYSEIENLKLQKKTLVEEIDHINDILTFLRSENAKKHSGLEALQNCTSFLKVNAFVETSIDVLQIIYKKK